MPSPNPWRRSTFLLLAVVGGLVWVTSGCVGSGPKLAPVSGRVTVGNKPLTSGWVTFKPDKAKGNTFGGEAVGQVNEKGEYTLQTNGQPGAPLGAYKVIVTATAATTEDNTKPPTKSLVNTTYAFAETTPLEKEVVDQPAPGAYDLKLSP